MGNQAGNENLEQTLARKTVSAIRNRNHVRVRGSSSPHLNQHTPHLWGADAAFDWLDAHWSTIQEHLVECAECGRSESSLLLPESGPAARSALLSRFKEVFPKSTVAAHRENSITVDWTDLTVPEGM